MKTGLEMITEERVKQIAKYGYTAFHDSHYQNQELLFGALTYLMCAISGKEAGIHYWPFEQQYFHSEGYIEDLKKVGAFVAAELDRLQVN